MACTCSTNTLISLTVFYKVVSQKSPPPQFFNFSFSVTDVKNKFPDLGGNPLLPNDSMNTLCEINAVFTTGVREVFFHPEELKLHSDLLDNSISFRQSTAPQNRQPIKWTVLCG